MLETTHGGISQRAEVASWRYLEEVHLAQFALHHLDVVTVHGLLQSAVAELRHWRGAGADGGGQNEYQAEHYRPGCNSVWTTKCKRGPRSRSVCSAAAALRNERTGLRRAGAADDRKVPAALARR